MTTTGICKYFQQGRCHFGSSCKFSHNTNQTLGGVSSTVCQFFQEGRCSFDSNCKYLHVSRSNAAATGSSLRFGTPNRFSAVQGGTAAADRSTMNPDEMVTTIGQEMQDWEKVHMWPFSCYSYIKDGPCINGFHDYSPEELRLEAYRAQKENKAPEFQNNFKQLVNIFQQKRQELKNPSMQVRQNLISEIEAFKKTQSAGQTASTGNSPFGKTSAFGGSSRTFGGGGSTFGGSQTVFGASSGSAFQVQTADQQKSVFGSPSAFGASNQSTTGLASGGSVFGSKQTVSFGGNAFGSTANPSSSFGAGMSSSSVFGSSSTGFGGTSGTASAFGQPQTTTSSVFGQAQTTAASSFGQTQSSPSFGSPQASSAFGQTPVSSAGFGATSTSTFPAAPVSTTSSSSFGATPAPQINPFTGTVNTIAAPGGAASSGGSSVFSGGSAAVALPVEDACFSPLDQLTELELEAFKANKFERGRIPLKPPPRELCT